MTMKKVRVIVIAVVCIAVICGGFFLYLFEVYDNIYLTGEMKVYVPLTNGALMNTKVDEANIY